MEPSGDKFSVLYSENIFGSFSNNLSSKKASDLSSRQSEVNKNKEIDCPQNDKEWCVEDQDGAYEKINEDDYILVNLLDNQETYTAYMGGPIW